LQWSVSAFWREPIQGHEWRSELPSVLESDGIRLLQHRFAAPDVSQFFVSTLPAVAPVTIVQRIKGRLQYLVRSDRPKALKGNYALRSIGNVTRQTVENYVANQVEHHQYSDPRFIERLNGYQINDAAVDLSKPQRTTHGLYWYNLHIVLVRNRRQVEWGDSELAATRAMIVKVAAAKAYRLSRAGILPDHVHLLFGCPIEQSPAEVVLGLMNNLAFAHRMQDIFQFGAFVGTVGEYDNGAIR
jgi:REP element-mobilizing transposase RayT